MSRKMFSIVFCVVASLTLLVAGPLQATVTWDIGDDFSSTTNPLGQWAYGQMDMLDATPTSTFTPYPIYTAPPVWAIPGVEAWEATDANGNNSNISHNTTGSTANMYDSNWYPDAVVAHPFGNPGRLSATARWTAPEAGIYTIDSSFMRVQYHHTVIDVPVSVSHDATELFSSETAGVDVAVPYDNIGVTMAAGEALYFSAIPNMEWGAVAWVQIDATITDGGIPEPGTLALLATGLIGLLCYAWKKRR